MIEQPQLPYKKNALEPTISELVMKLHYDKHHKGYIKNLNQLIEGTSYEQYDIEQIVKYAPFGPIYNNAGQTLNHNYFWETMTPESDEQQISEQLQTAIDESFGSLDKMKQKFNQAGSKLFGSGWVWLVVENSQLHVRQYKNADNPVRYDLGPLLPCDVWEHAYYIDYHNDKGKYLESFWKVVNWKKVSERYKRITRHG